jgi:hypothetical protein
LELAAEFLADLPAATADTTAVTERARSLRDHFSDLAGKAAPAADCASSAASALYQSKAGRANDYSAFFDTDA